MPPISTIIYGIEAEQDEQRAADLAEKLGIKFISGFGDVPEFVRTHKLSVEEGARQLRYRWLFEQAEELKAQALAVGHTADDQVETVIDALAARFRPGWTYRYAVPADTSSLELGYSDHPPVIGHLANGNGRNLPAGTISHRFRMRAINLHCTSVTGSAWN